MSSVARLSSLRVRYALFVLLLQLLALSPVIAAEEEPVPRVAGIPGLTRLERSMLQAHGLPNGVEPPITGPVRYVAPGIRVVERQAEPPSVPLTDPGAIRRYLARTRLVDCRGFQNLSFEDGTFDFWTTAGAAGTGAPSVCGAPMPPEATITNPGLLSPTNNAACINQVYSDSHAARLGDGIAWGFDPANEPQCTSISQDVVIHAGTSIFAFVYAVMAENPGHGFGNDPYFNVRVDDITTATNLYNVTDYTTSFDPGNPCTPWCAGVAGVVYRCWTEVTLDLSGLAGHTVRLSLLSSDCSPSSHWCSVFLDGANIDCFDLVGPEASSLSATCDSDSAGTSLCATLLWTAPSDQTMDLGTDCSNCVPVIAAAASYDIRWSTSPILNALDFAAANQVAGEPTPAVPGSPETMQVCGLPLGDLYFAMQSSDNAFNTSPLALLEFHCDPEPRLDCSNAVASEPTLWPPDHQYHSISVLGVTDPNGGTVTITVTGITQDEPLNTRGDGNTCPDGIIESGQASVRAERTGTPGIPGNGRVYAISYTATDSHGATCNGVVNVCVPHDQGQHATCIDDGQRYNSTGDCRGGNSVQTEVKAYGLSVAGVTSNEATIEFAVPTDSDVQVAVFDVAGRRLATLENGTLTMGRYTRSWNMRGVPAGLYFARMSADGNTISKAVLKLR